MIYFAVPVWVDGSEHKDNQYDWHDIDIDLRDELVTQTLIGLNSQTWMRFNNSCTIAFHCVRGAYRYFVSIRSPQL
jgi:hypothetical protein